MVHVERKDKIPSHVWWASMRWRTCVSLVLLIKSTTVQEAVERGKDMEEDFLVDEKGSLWKRKKRETQVVKEVEEGNEEEEKKEEETEKGKGGAREA